ncbi:copper homeostasis CutC domain-containing protein [Pholiota molesta]|nr:copper homeostasis CutC domain-containing protein [Pholiota molesta]
MAILPESLIIEVCVDSVQSAISATRAGADRLEICANLGAGGGTTPTSGLVRSIQRAVEVPLMIMIRPRIGDFLYSDDELEVILEDIRVFKKLGNIRGFVVGALTKDGQVDVERMKIAFDMTQDPIQAMADIADIGGISRILTSGLSGKAPQGLPVLQKLFNRREELVEDDIWGLTVMPGSGINGKTLPALLEALLPLGLREFHLSGGKWVPNNMTFRRDCMGMGLDHTLKDEVKEVRQISDIMWKEFVSTIRTKYMRKSQHIKGVQGQ